MPNIKNNSLAMIATVALVGALASLIGLFESSTCVESTQVDGWTSCAAIAEQRNVTTAVLLAVAVLGFAVSIVRKRRSK